MTLKNSKNKCKAAWQLIKQESENVKPINFITEIINGGESVYSPNKIANEFNNYWVNLTSKVNDNLQITHKNHISSSIFLKPYGFAEIQKVILSLKNTKAVGYDNFATKVLKMCCNELVPILTHLINLSFSEGCFPDALKYAIVRPLFKKGDRRSLETIDQ